MLQFIAGLGVACVVLVPVLVQCKRTGRNRTCSAEAGEQFEELARLTGELAHEIKNPLSTVKVNLQLIREDLETLADDDVDGDIARARRKIGVVKKETDRLEQILESFLRYVAKTELQLVSADINELVGDMIDFYAPQAQKHAITLRYQLSGSQIMCRVDVDMLKQVLLNLFVNAQQAMTGPGELMVTTNTEGGFAIIRISDTGPGIAPDKLPHIFDAYFSSRRDGTGLGLSTARKIILAHGGSIDVQSEEGKGASFTIRLPRQS